MLRKMGWNTSFKERLDNYKANEKINFINDLILRIVNRPVSHLSNDNQYLTGYALCQHDIIDEMLLVRYDIENELKKDYNSIKPKHESNVRCDFIKEDQKNEDDGKIDRMIAHYDDEIKRYKAFAKEIADICLHSADEKYIAEKLRNAIVEHNISIHNGALLDEYSDDIPVKFNEDVENEIHD